MHVDNKGIIDGLWREERKSIDPEAGDADLWNKIWEVLHLLISKEVLVEVEHVKAHSTKKDKKEMSHIERFVTDGNEKADELADAGAMLDEGFMAEARAETVQQEREEVCAALQCAASFHCWWKKGRTVKSSSRSKKKSGCSWTREAVKHETEWCAQANKYRCMRCGRSGKYMNMPGKCTGPKYLSEKLGKSDKRHLGGHDLVRRVDRQVKTLTWCWKCSGMRGRE